MAKLLKLGIFAALVTYVSAKCDNQCSGHGTCMTDDVCQCYDNFGSGLSHDSGDCSDRICPFEVAWVDHPDNQGHHHKYMECAGKGICDRSTGECQCFEGYEGKGCQRATCPNDCSGHGRCEYIEDLPYGTTWNDWVDSGSANSAMQTRTQSLFSDDAKTFDYHLWDKSKSRKCVCDATYGDLDCSKRLCPYGTDVLDTKDDTYYGLSEQKYQEQTILLSSLSGDFDELDGKSFALTFTSRLNETFTTVPIALSSDTEYIDLQNDIKLALLKLPNGVIDGVKVTVDYIDNDELYKLVSDSLFPAAAISATMIEVNGVDKLGVASGIATSLSTTSGSIASGCVLGGNIVKYATHTTITAFGLTDKAQSSANFGSTHALGAATPTVSSCTAGNVTVIASADISGELSINDYVAIPTCGISSAKVASVATFVITLDVAATSTASAGKIYELDQECKVGSTVVGRFSMVAASGGKVITNLLVGSGLTEGCDIYAFGGAAVDGAELDSYAAFFPGYTGSGITGGSFNADSAACSVGSDTVTLSGSDSYTVGDYVSLPHCGIGSAKVTGQSSAVVTLDTAATIAQTRASVFTLGYTCVLNGQIIARMGLSVADGSTNEQFSADKVIVGYGGLVNGCSIKDKDGAAATGFSGSVFKAFAGDFAWTSQDIGHSDSSASAAKSFTCAQSYLPGTHQFTTPNGIARGQVYDQSGNYIGGQDQTILPALNANNHRRRLSSGSGHSGLITIKIGFTGPSVQGPQHLMIVEDYQCGAGCTPKLSGMPLETRQTSYYWSTIVELTKSDYNSYECGRRGKCDYSSGLCQCFAGYVGDNCNTLTTLV